jgi:hypothetical protein
MNRSTERVIKAIAEHTGIPSGQILSRDRCRSTSTARHVAIYVLRENQVPRPSFPELAREFKLDNSTVMNACERIRERLGHPGVTELVQVGVAALEVDQDHDTLLTKCRRLRALEAEIVELKQEIQSMSLGTIGSAAE